MEDKKSAYTCSFCGVTLETCNQWGPICKLTGKRVCATCCFRCEHHYKWSGLWKCEYITEEDRKTERLKRAEARFEEENRRISEAFHKKRKEERRQWAIKQAKKRAKAEKEKQRKRG